MKRRKRTSAFATEVEPVVDDRNSLGAVDAAQGVVPTLFSVLVTGAAKSRFKIHRYLGNSQSTERPSNIQEILSIVGR